MDYKKIIVNGTNEIFNSIREVSHFFNVTPRTITRWLKTGNKVDFYTL